MVRQEETITLMSAISGRRLSEDSCHCCPHCRDTETNTDPSSLSSSSTLLALAAVAAAAAASIRTEWSHQPLTHLHLTPIGAICTLASLTASNPLQTHRQTDRQTNLSKLSKVFYYYCQYCQCSVLHGYDYLDNLC